MSNTPGWESVKENAAPLQRGRNVSTLERAAATALGLGGGSKTSETDPEKQIEEFERFIRPSEAPHVTETQDDPLVHWMAYIKYYQDHLPSDTHQQFLLMERCTRALVKMPRYANDDRFISVCAKYADKTKEPGQVFKYLHQQKVGQKTALFWVAWAFVAEKGGDFPFAEHVYKKGISKDAQPLNMLKVRHKQFQRRMSRYWLNASQQNDQLDEYDGGEAAGSTACRGTLGGLSHDRVRLNDRSRVAPQLSHRSRVPSRRAPARSGSGLRSTSNTAPQGSLAIFVESDVENAPNSFLDQPVIESKRVIERESDRRKENTLDGERWNERGGLSGTSSSSGGYLSRSSHSRTGSRGAPPPFAVFVDDECVAQHEREESVKQNQADRNRTARDDRTFRERSGEGLVCCP
jgi:Mad3/BUB1 homology region 1